MKDELLAEFERSLIDLKAMDTKNSRGIKQMKAHIRNVRNKLRSIRAGKEAYEIERRYKPWKQTKFTSETLTN